MHANRLLTDTALLPTVATVSVWSASLPGCATNTQSATPACTPVTWAAASLRCVVLSCWVHLRAFSCISVDAGGWATALDEEVTTINEMILTLLSSTDSAASKWAFSHFSSDCCRCHHVHELVKASDGWKTITNSGVSCVHWF